jgi:hypothetical protein
MRATYLLLTLASTLGLAALTGCEAHVTTDRPPDVDVDVQRPPAVDVDVTPKAADVDVKVD